MAATAAKGCYQNPADKLFTDKKAKDMGSNGVSQELHLKMSKKIAQLTKVIYALNTRNDEHESVVESLKESHEIQMSQVLTDTKEKISKFQSLIGNEMEYKRKITRLETCVADYEKFKKEALQDFEEHKKTASAKEHELLHEHNTLVGELQRKLEGVRDRYQQLTARLEALSTTFEQQKTAALEEQKASYQKWIDELVKNQSEMQNNLSGATDQLHEKYKREIASLSERVQGLEAERSKVTADYEAKLTKAQQFYEKELKAVQEQKANDSNEEATRLKKLYDESRKEFYEAQAASKKRVDDLLSKLSMEEEELEKMKAEMARRERAGGDEERKARELREQIDQVSQDLSTARSELKVSKADLEASREQQQEQKVDIAKKSELIKELQASLMQQETALSEARSVLSKTEDRLRGLEKEKMALNDAKNSVTSEHSAHLQRLEKSLQAAAKEKEEAVEEMKAKLRQAKEEAEAREKELAEKQRLELETMMKKHKDEHRRVSVNKDSAMDKLREEFDNRLEYEKMKLEVANTSLKEKMEALRSDLSSKLRTAESEVQRLQNILHERDGALGSSEASLRSLQDAQQRLQCEVAALSGDLRAAKATAAAAKREADEARTRSEADVAAVRSEAGERLRTQAEELERKFTAQLQRELAKARADVRGDAEAVRRTELERLAAERDAEAARSAEVAAAAVAGKEGELAAFRKKAEAERREAEERMEAERRKMEEERKRAEEKWREAQANWRLQEERKEAELRREMREASEMAEREALARQEQLREELKAEMRAMELANRVAQEKKREEEEERRRELRDELQSKSNREKEEMRTDLLARFGADMGALQRDSEAAQLRLHEELERHREEARNEIDSLTLKFERAQFDIKKKENCIAKLETDLKGLQEGVKEMGRELDVKGKEVLKARSEVNQKVKQIEDELKSRAERELKETKRRAEDDAQQLLSQFNQAQELLKDKIAELKIRLDDAEERYRSRESRDEDLEAIEELRGKLEQREKDVRRLYEEKKFFQMELVNRETNFNKVFNNSPQVGLVNPLTAATKVARKDSKAAKNSRLAPLPNSPLHDDSLNPSRPLPPPAKKFVA